MRKYSVLFLPLLMICLSACGSTPPIEAQQTGEVVHEDTAAPEPDLSNLVTYEVEESPNICLMRFTNNADRPVEVEVNFVFDVAGVKQDAGYGHLYCLGSGNTGVICMEKPTDDNGMPIEGATTDFSVTVNEQGLFDDTGSHTDAISVVDSADDSGNVTVEVSNASDSSISMVDVYIVFYSGGVPVAYDDYGWVDEMTAGHTGYWTFDRPNYHDIDVTPITYDKYELFINHAYNSQY